MYPVWFQVPANLEFQFPEPFLKNGWANLLICSQKASAIYQ
jgi:hypothetical protein